MGEALDALASWGEVGETVPVIIQRVGPDQFFSQAQFDRLTDLQSRIGRLTPVEQRELEELIDAELDASVARLDYFSDQTSSHNSR